MHAYHQRLHLISYVSDGTYYEKPAFFLSSVSTFSYKPTYKDISAHNHTKIPVERPSYTFSFILTYIRRHLCTKSYINDHQTPIIHIFPTTYLYNHTYILNFLNKKLCCLIHKNRKGVNHTFCHHFQLLATRWKRPTTSLGKTPSKTLYNWKPARLHAPVRQLILNKCLEGNLVDFCPTKMFNRTKESMFDTLFM